MQIVIDIPKELYEAYKGRPPMLGDAGMDMIAQSIAKGTPLPKGHGRLIDADVFEKRLMNATLYYMGEKADVFDLRFAAGLDSAAERLVSAPTIIEADKEE